MLTVTLSANHWYIYICSCHRLHTVQTLLHSVTYHIQMTCLYPDCIRRRGWWGWCHRPDSCQANDCNSQVTLTKGWWCWNLLTASKHSHIKKLNIERKAKRSCNIKKCLFFFSYPWFAEMYIASIYSTNWVEEAHLIGETCEKQGIVFWNYRKRCRKINSWANLQDEPTLCQYA